MRRRSFQNIIFCVAALSVLAPVATAGTEEFCIVVNQSNAVTGEREEIAGIVRQLFLKQKSEWKSGVEVLPLGRNEGSAAEVAFRANVLSMTSTEFENHWAKLKQIRGETPPREVGSVRILLRTVSRHEGAFGFISKSEIENLPPEVKVLLEFGG